jgi:methyltransferase (TIGR00027 family)
VRNTSSFTAEVMALQRSMESHRPARTRLFTDPYADAFLRPLFRVLAMDSAIPGVRRVAAGCYDLLGGPGPRVSGITRTKIIDDEVAQAAPDHTQMVILGAGYDTRAHRLAPLADRHVFEVDHPVTQAAKRSVIARLGLATAHVAYVPVDFEHDDLAARLVAADFERTAKTIFLWEGVTQYLTGEAVDATLTVIKDLAPAGGLLFVTYIDSRTFTEPCPFPEARRWLRWVERAGEPWIFGLLPDEAEEFFALRGFRLRQDISTLDASRAWRDQYHRRELGSGLYRVATCEIETPRTRPST